MIACYRVLNFSIIFHTEYKHDMLVTYRFIFKPEEVAEVEVSITQCDSGVTLLEIVSCCADQAPHLQHGILKEKFIFRQMLQMDKYIHDCSH